MVHIFGKDGCAVEVEVHHQQIEDSGVHNQVATDTQGSEEEEASKGEKYDFAEHNAEEDVGDLGAPEGEEVEEELVRENGLGWHEEPVANVKTSAEEVLLEEMDVEGVSVELNVCEGEEGYEEKSESLQKERPLP